MKTQQLSTEASDAKQTLRARVCEARASLPTLTTMAVAIASSVVLLLGGCAGSAGIALVG